MSGSQEVPPVTTTATGTITATLNGARDLLSYTVTWSGLSGSVTNSHFHTGLANQAGGVTEGVTLSTTASSGSHSGTWAIPSTSVADLLAGKIYFNIHTAANSGGEIRGALLQKFTVENQTPFTLEITPTDLWGNVIPDTTYRVRIESNAPSLLSGLEGGRVLVRGATGVELTPQGTFPSGGLSIVGLVEGALPIGGVAVSTNSNAIGAASVTVGAATIFAPSNLSAVDNPNDAGGYVKLSFWASPNHPDGNAANDTAASLPINYYAVYRSTGTDVSTAAYAGWLPATTLFSGQSKQLTYVISTNGASESANYWVAAVSGELPPGGPVGPAGSGAIGKEVAEQLGLPEGTIMGTLVEATNEPAGVSASFATLDNQGNLISPTSNANLAVPINNQTSVRQDLNGNGTVDVLDIAIIAQIFANSAEFDAAIDLNNDGEISILDIASIATVFGQNVSGKDVKELAAVVSNGVNTRASLAVATTSAEFGDDIELRVSLADLTAFAGYQMTISYNPEDYELRTAEAGQYMADAQGLFLYNDNKAGEVTIGSVVTGYLGREALEGAGEVAVIRLRWLGHQNSDVSVTNIQVMDRGMHLNVIDNQVIAKPVPVPDKFTLAQNFPNPFNPTTAIRYAIPEASHVRLVIYNLLGQKIRTLVDEEQDAAFRRIVWDGQNDVGVRVASGLYIYRLEAGDFVQSKKMVLMK
jgi:hypothetical protein